ncbi:MAG TPA: C-GCAxxG-C-C family protein [Myxococcota bacterium]|nr:C-GCAxxG-C-C family protein [Myxococcota bacterium]
MSATVPEAEAAVSMFTQGFTCAQSVLGGFADRYGLSREHAARLGCAFGGGVARTGQTCGAVSGALLVIGLAHGATAPGDHAAREKTYAVASELGRRFRERHGSIACRELLGVDIGTPEGREAAIRSGLFKTLCPELVRHAAEIAAQLV